MTKDEMKDKISMALKDPILQMGFEVICSKLSRLEKENAELKAKAIIKDLLSVLPKENIEGVYETVEVAEQFLREIEDDDVRQTFE